MENIFLWFQLAGKRGGLVSRHKDRKVQICRDWKCRLCNLSLREALRGFRAGKLEVQLTLHRTPSFWDPTEYYLAHLVSIPEHEQKTDEGIEFDVSKSNTLVVAFLQGAILIDPGSTGFGGPSPLKQLVAGQKVLATIVSHGHLDHWNGLGEIRSPVFMTNLAFRFASRHAYLQRDFAMERILREAKMAIPGQPILLEKPALRIDTISLPHSIPEAMGLVIRGDRERMVYLGDFRLSGWEGKTKAKAIAAFQEVAKERIDLLALTIFNAHIPGFTPTEALVIDALAGILAKTEARVIIACFSSNLERIRQIVEMARLLSRPVAFCGAGMENSQELLGIAADEEAIDSERVVILVTGCQAEEWSVLWRIANQENPSFELRPDDTLVFSSRAIPGNEEVLRQLIVMLRPRVGRLVLNSGESSQLGLKGLEIEEALTHISGHASSEDIRLALEILRPKRVLAWPQQFPQIEAFREIVEPLGIKVIPETERVIEI